jgi:5-methylthioadenosine/S-adenosylhomocysteine deaminase
MPTTHDTLLHAGTLITQDGDRRVLCDAGIAVTGGRIDAVGSWPDMRGLAAREIIDLSGDIVLPGLINTHTHAAMTVFRGLEDDLPLMDWLTGHIWPAESRLTQEMVGIGAALACAEMLATGTTTFCDLYVFERAVAETAGAIGIRALVGEGVFDTPNASYANQEQAFAKVDDLISCCRSLDLINPCLVAHSVYATSQSSLRRLHALARDHGLTLTLHAAESPAETAMCLERFSRRPVEMLRDMDLLGPDLLIAHAVDVTGEELGLLSAHKVKVSHNPRSNMKLASGMAPVAAMRKANIRVGLGTDGAASNNALNMFAEMNQAALLAKVRDLDPTALPAQAVLDMATSDAAAALNLPCIGSIEPGKQADIIALRGDAPNFQPPHDPVSHMAYAASGHEIRLTMVSGRVLFRDGRFFTLDYPALLKEMKSVRKWARGD